MAAKAVKKVRHSWTLAVAAGRSYCSPRGMAFVVADPSFDPWGWIDEATVRFERRAYCAMGAREAADWIESEVDSCSARFGLLAREWDKKALVAYSLMAAEAKGALSDMAKPGSWIEMPGLKWGLLDPKSLALASQSAVSSLSEKFELDRECWPLGARAQSLRLWM